QRSRFSLSPTGRMPRASNLNTVNSSNWVPRVVSRCVPLWTVVGQDYCSGSKMKLSIRKKPSGVFHRYAPGVIARRNNRGALSLLMRQSRMLSRLSLARERCNHSFTNRYETRAWPFNAGTLAADAGAFEQKRQAVRKQIRFYDSGPLTKFRQAIALVPLELFDDMPRRMIAFGEFDCGIREIATAAIVENTLGTSANPRPKLPDRVSCIVAIKAAPNLVDFTCDVAQTGDDQIVLRAEVAVERHLIGAGHLRDRVNADPSDPVLTEEITGRADNALPRPQRDLGTVLHRLLQERSSMSLDRV